MVFNIVLIYWQKVVYAPSGKSIAELAAKATALTFTKDVLSAQMAQILAKPKL